MSPFHNVMQNVVKQAAAIEPDDYFREDGIRMCGRCHEPKEQRITWMDDIPEELLIQLFGPEKKVPAVCKCRQKKLDEQRREDELREKMTTIMVRRRDCFHNADDEASTFEVDDQADKKVSDAMRLYADTYAEKMAQNFGLLLYGPVGTGKTFYAACIANRLLEQGYTVEMTSFTRIVNTIQGMYDGKQAYIDRLARKDLLIIDDLGVERGSEFMLEQVTGIIDARYKSGKPLIVTTNISLEEIKKPKDLTYRRMYDRLLEICHPVKVDGKSRRRAAVMKSYGERNALLGL